MAAEAPPAVGALDLGVADHGLPLFGDPAQDEPGHLGGKAGGVEGGQLPGGNGHAGDQAVDDLAPPV